MKPDTAEAAALDVGIAQSLPGAGAVVGVPAVEYASGGSMALPARQMGLPSIRSARVLDESQLRSLAEAWRVLLASRLLVLLAGIVAIMTLGWGAVHSVVNPPGVTGDFGRLGDLLAAPFARWDSAWFLIIAAHGYSAADGLGTFAMPAFFPLYPMLVGLFGGDGGALVVTGVLVSLVSFFFALYGLHRLTLLELAPPHRWAHPDAARLVLMLTAFAPMAFYYSAVYSEALYFALSVGVFWCSRQGRWAWAGILGGLAAATRSAGVVLALPMVMLYLYGPREDRLPDAGVRALASSGRAAGARWAGWARALLPRYRITPSILWALLVPAGLGAYMLYIASTGGDAMLPFHAQEVWGRHFAGPFGAVWDGTKAAWEGIRQVLTFSSHPIYYRDAGGNALIASWHNLRSFIFLVLAVPAIVGVFRGLPLAYGVYVLAALALPLSYPVTSQPLMSLPRFLLVLFPLNMWLAAWLIRHRRWQRPVLVLSGAFMAFFVMQFATWRWVA